MMAVNNVAVSTRTKWIRAVLCQFAAMRQTIMPASRNCWSELKTFDPNAMNSCTVSGMLKGANLEPR